MAEAAAEAAAEEEVSEAGLGVDIGGSLGACSAYDARLAAACLEPLGTRERQALGDLGDDGCEELSAFIAECFGEESEGAGEHGHETWRDGAVWDDGATDDAMPIELLPPPRVQRLEPVPLPPRAAAAAEAVLMERPRQPAAPEASETGSGMFMLCRVTPVCDLTEDDAAAARFRHRRALASIPANGRTLSMADALKALADNGVIGEVGNMFTPARCTPSSNAPQATVASGDATAGQVSVQMSDTGTDATGAVHFATASNAGCSSGIEAGSLCDYGAAAEGDGALAATAAAATPAPSSPTRARTTVVASTHSSFSSMGRLPTAATPAPSSPARARTTVVASTHSSFTSMGRLPTKRTTHCHIDDGYSAQAVLAPALAERLAAVADMQRPGPLARTSSTTLSKTTSKAKAFKVSIGYSVRRATMASCRTLVPPVPVPLCNRAVGPRVTPRIRSSIAKFLESA